MNDDYKKVLITIVSLSKGANSGQVKRSSLANVVKVDEYHLKTYLDSLQNAQYIQIEKRKNVTLIIPTIQGLEKSEAWEMDLKSKSLPGRLRSAAKWLIAGSAAALLGLVFWYFGFSPDTIGLQPFDARIPIKVYDVGTYPTTDPGYGWVSFTPSKAFPIKINENLHLYDENDLRSVIGEYVPATLSGDVNFKLAIENVATKYQVDIQSIDVIVKSQPGKDIEDLYTMPVWGLGGASIWEYEVSISPTSGKPLENGSRIYHATMTSNETAVDYLYVEPGKRETISVHVKLDDVGNYTLIPVITYSFRDKTNNINVNPYTISYPKLYRTWVVDPQANLLDTSHMVVNNLTGEVNQEDRDSGTMRVCIPHTKWIFFTASMIEWGVLHQAFIIDSDGKNLRLLDSYYYDPRDSLSIAWTNSGLVRLKFEGWTGQKSELVYELFNPASGEKIKWSEQVEKSILIGSEISIPSYSPSYTTPDGQWLIDGGKKLTITKPDGSCTQEVLAPNFGEISNISLQP